MLIFIGGAARTGKGILARKLVSECDMPYLSVDVLKMGLTRGVPSFYIDPDEGAIPVAEKLWPLLLEMSRNLIVEEIDYAVEGEVLPKFVAPLQQIYATQVRSCFLGYATIKPEKKLRLVRKHSDFPNDWPRDYDDPSLLKIIEREINFSHYLKSECLAYGLEYFDTSVHFTQTIETAFEYLTQQ